jgi:uncharacterized protein VirK/YbjX
MSTNDLSLAPFPVRIWHACAHMHPGAGLRSLKRRAFLLVRCAQSAGALRRWHGDHTEPAFTDMLARHALVPVCTERPFVSTRWSAKDRMRVLSTHYRLADTLGSLLRFARNVDGAQPLAALDEIQPGLALKLEKPLWFVNEGEVSLALFAGETRLYSLLFTLGTRDGLRVAYVGALQGQGSEDAKETYKALTSEAHGLRPRDLLFTAFRQLCGELGVARILAVCDESHARRSSYFAGTDKVHFSMDEAWAEYGGTLGADGFFDIPAQVTYRTLEEIPSRKRAQYRRRYELLDALAARIAATVRSHRGGMAEPAAAPAPALDALTALQGTTPNA